MGHRGVGKALTERRLDIHPELTGRFLGALQRFGIRYAAAVIVMAFHMTQFQLFLNLRARTVYQNDLDAQRM